MKFYAAHRLNPLDNIKAYHSYGLEFETLIGANIGKPIIKNQLELSGGIKRIKIAHYLRDQFGQLHVLKENTDKL